MKKQILLLSFVLICSALCAQDLYQFRIAVAGGYSYRTTIFPANSKSEETKNGFHYGMELNYYFNETFGLGINYCANHFNSESTHKWTSVNILEKVRLQQIIPTFSVRVFDKQKQGAFLVNIGAGYIDYKSRDFLVDYNNKPRWTSKGWTIGMLWGIGYDIPISQSMAIYVQASFTGGIITKSTSIDETTGDIYVSSVDKIYEGEGIGRINLSIGLRFAD